MSDTKQILCVHCSDPINANGIDDEGTDFCGANPDTDKHELPADTTTEVPASAKKFGTDVRPALAAYNKAVAEAERVCFAATSTLDAKLHRVQLAVRELVDDYNTSIAINDLLDSLTAPKRSQAHAEAQAVRDHARETAKEIRDAALGDDPFTKFVATRIKDDFGIEYSEILFAAMPLTFDSMKQLANDHRWCSDYENAMREAVRRGALPADTVEIRRPVPHYDVPGQYGAKEDEKWERVGQVYAYARTADHYGTLRNFYVLRDHLVGESTYVKVADAPSED